MKITGDNLLSGKFDASEKQMKIPNKDYRKKGQIVQVAIPPEVHQGWSDDSSVQRYNKELSDASIESARKYAEKHGYEHVLYTDQKWPHLHPQVEWFRPFYDRVFKRYDWTIVVDNDVILNAKDDIVNDCDINKLNYVNPFPDRQEMFNSGVVVVGKGAYSPLLYHADIERAGQLLNTDQQELQILIDVLGPNFSKIIHPRWNNYWDFEFEDSFLHFKGMYKEKRFENLYMQYV